MGRLKKWDNRIWARSTNPSVLDGFDVTFYVEKLKALGFTPPDPLKHYQEHGWRLALDPSESFSIDKYWNANPDVFNAGVEPLAHWNSHGAQENRKFKDSFWDEEEATSLLKEHFDPTFYRNYNLSDSIYPQTSIEHFKKIGWRANFDPTPWFDTEYYLKKNNLDFGCEYPAFLHYLKSNLGIKRVQTNRLFASHFNIGKLDELNPILPKVQLMAPRLWRTLGYEELIGDLIKSGFDFKKQFIVSMGNNSFLDSSGGIELIIRAEHDECLETGKNHIYIFKSHLQRPTFESETTPYSICINSISYESVDLLTVLKFLELLRNNSSYELFQLHGSIFSPLDDVKKLSDSATFCRYFMHDYSLNCNGFTLQRNGLENCDAPEPESMLCNTCIWGGTRKNLLTQVSALIADNNFQIIAPSMSAAALFSKTYPEVSVEVRGHQELELISKRTDFGVNDRKKFTVAFIGHPVAHKGWNEFLLFSRYAASRNDFHLLHLGTKSKNDSDYKYLNFIEVKLDKGQSKTTRHLIENNVDVVFIWPLCKETYSFVTAEAIAAGCLVLTNTCSGNVQAMAHDFSRDIALDNLEKLLALTKSGELEAIICKYFAEEEIYYYEARLNSYLEI